MIWFVAAGAVALGGLIISGCSDDSSSEGNGSSNVDEDDIFDDAYDAVAADDGSGEIVADAGTTDVDAGPDVPDNKIADGVYRFLEADCDIVDIDIEGGDSLIALCGEPVPGEGYVRFFRTNTDSPHLEHSSQMFNAVAGNMPFDEGDYSTSPIQIISAADMGYENVHIVPFTSSISDCMSGLAISGPAESYPVNRTFSPFDYFGDGNDLVSPCIKSALIAQNAEGAEIWYSASIMSQSSEIGILRACDMSKSSPYNIVNCNTFPVNLSGKNPVALEGLPHSYPTSTADDYGFAAVLCSKGYKMSELPADSTKSLNACIDIVELNHLPTDVSSIVETIDLGVNEVAALSELPTTENREHAVVIADNKIIVVNLKNPGIAGVKEDTSIDMSKVRDVAISDDRVYVAHSDHVLIYGIENPASPTYEGKIDVGKGIGALDVDAGGVIFARVDGDDESGSKSQVYAIMPDEAEIIQ